MDSGIIKSRRDTHTYTQSSHRDYIMQHTSRPVNSIGYTITYQMPYNECEWRTKSFTTLDEAERQIEFYKSCGSDAKLVTW
jgi:hypothetical protein